jgi:co-chaperonin GroES (HSP10)
MENSQIINKEWTLFHNVFGNRVLLQREEVEMKNSFNILSAIQPNSRFENIEFGTVLQLPEEISKNERDLSKNSPLSESLYFSQLVLQNIKIGDLVCFDKNGGSMKYISKNENGEFVDIIIIEAKNIIGIMNKSIL